MSCKNLSLFFVFIFCFSCKNSTIYHDEVSINWSNFEEKELKGKVVLLDEEVMKPYHLMVRDSILMTVNERTEKICHLFNLNTGKKIGERIALGQGPNEMIHPFFINNDDSLKLFDPMTSLVHTYSLNDFIESENIFPTNIIQLDVIPYFGELSNLNNSLIGFSSKPDAPCYIFNEKGQKTHKTFGEYPKGIMGQYTDLEIVNAFRCIVATNGKNRVVLSHMFTDLIDFYNENGDLLKRVCGPEHFYTQFIEYKEGERIGSFPNRDYYRDAFYSPLCIDDKLFVLYNGKFIMHPDYNLLARDILVFDLNGNPLNRLRLDKGVSRITVDSKNRKIYGISDDPDYHIVEYSY